MRENRLSHFPEPHGDMSPPSGWDADEMSTSLASSSTRSLHGFYGEGMRFPIGEPETPQGTLEVYPEAGRVRYSSEGSDLALSFSHPPYKESDRLIFSDESEHEYRTAIFQDTGEVTIFLVPKPPLAPVSEIAMPPQTIAHWEESYIAADEAAPPTTNIKTESNNKQETKKGERVELFGRAGKNPRVRETAKGTLIAKFPLAVHETPEGQTEEVTNWFTVVAFRAMAERVADMVKKGEQYHVIGYKQDREYNGKTYEEVNAVAVRQPKTEPS